LTLTDPEQRISQDRATPRLEHRVKLEFELGRAPAKLIGGSACRWTCLAALARLKPWPVSVPASSGFAAELATFATLHLAADHRPATASLS
jgi:hypothetical protein